MILSDLLGAPIFDHDGNRLGIVIDARFTIDGTPHQLLSDARLHGLIVGHHATHSFMGYERTDELAPAPIARFLRWRERGTFLVLWKDIERISPDQISLRARFTRFSPRIPSNGEHT